MDESHEGHRFACGVAEFNNRRFFDSHETWEEIWLSAPEPYKTFLQGLIQVAAAFHHYTRDNRAGAQSLLRQGLEKLEKFPNNYRGLRLEALRSAARDWAAALAAGESPSADAFPQIERVADASAATRED